MAEIPTAFRDLLEQKKAFANIATVMADGSPQVTPVWFDYANGKIRMNTAKGRVKARTMKQGSKVALAIMDPDNAYRYIQIRGHVERVTEHGADAHIDLLAKKYLGKDKYPYAQPGEQRVMFEIIPIRLETDLLQVWIVRQRGQALCRQRVPCFAERVEDGLIAVEKPVAEMALAQIEPDAFHRIEFWAVGGL